jgi:uncharacterized membrane protein required for colicin V production
MSLSTLVFFGLLAFFTWRGYQKGFIKSITRILSLIIAYPAAIFFTKPTAKWIMANSAIDGIIVYFIAGTGIFLLISITVTLLLNWIAQSVPEDSKWNIHSKYAGAGVGAFMGCIAGLVLVYFVSVALTLKTQDPHALKQATEISAETENNAGIQTSTTGTKKNVPHIKYLSEFEDSYIEASAKKLIGKAAATGVRLAVGDSTAANITEAFVENPQSMLTHVQAVNNNGQIKNLLADEKIQSILTTGDKHALAREPGFQELINNPHMQAILNQSDIDSQKGSEAAAEKLVEAWGKMQTLKHDPRVIAILTDPEFQAQLNSGNKLPLMMNPKLNQLTEIIFSSETPAANNMEKYQINDINNSGIVESIPAIHANAQSTETEKKPTTVYRWTDDEGNVHFSDKPVETKPIEAP